MVSTLESIPKPPKTDNPKARAIGAAVYRQACFAMASNSGEIVSRSRLAYSLGKSFDGQRDLYEACGYPVEGALTYNRYLGRYKRGDIAARICEAYPKAAYRAQPEVIDDEDLDDTAFDTEWAALVKQRKVWRYLERASILANIGRYSVLLLGFDDGAELSEPVKRAASLLYMMPYSEAAAKVDRLVNDPKDERHGLPETYKIELSNSDNADVIRSQEVVVHWTRTIHLAEGCLDSDVYGTPRLQRIYNRLQDLETTVAGSSEAYWQAGHFGIALTTQDDAMPDGQDMSDLEDEMWEYIHDVSKRYLRLSGISPQVLQGNPKDPRGNCEVLLQLISGSTGIPTRILTGSERGELASTQDENNWNNRTDEYRKDEAEPNVLRPFIDRLIAVGVLPEPNGGEYLVKWPPVEAQSPREEAEVADTWTKALAEYIKSGSYTMMTPTRYLIEVWGKTEDEAKQIIQEAYDDMAAEDEPTRTTTAEGTTEED